MRSGWHEWSIWYWRAAHSLSLLLVIAFKEPLSLEESSWYQHQWYLLAMVVPVMHAGEPTSKSTSLDRAEQTYTSKPGHVVATGVVLISKAGWAKLRHNTTILTIQCTTGKSEQQIRDRCTCCTNRHTASCKCVFKLKYIMFHRGRPVNLSHMPASNPQLKQGSFSRLPMCTRQFCPLPNSCSTRSQGQVKLLKALLEPRGCDKCMVRWAI